MTRRRWHLPTLLLALGALVLGQVAAEIHGLCSCGHDDDEHGVDGRGVDRIISPPARHADADGATDVGDLCPLCAVPAGHSARLPETTCWADASRCVGCIGATVPEGPPRNDVLDSLGPRAPPGKLA